jgi:hypothetical protein
MLQETEVPFDGPPNAWAWQQIDARTGVLKYGAWSLVVCIGEEGIFTFWRWRGVEFSTPDLAEA